MSKHKTKKRSQKGGDWYNPMSWFNNTTDYSTEPKKTMYETISGTTSNVLNETNNLLGTAAESTKEGLNNVVNSTSNLLNTNIDLTGSTNTNTINPTNSISTNPNPNPNPNPIYGGKRRKSKTLRKRKHKKGCRHSRHRKCCKCK